MWCQNQAWNQISLLDFNFSGILLQKFNNSLCYMCGIDLGRWNTYLSRATISQVTCCTNYEHPNSQEDVVPLDGLWKPGPVLQTSVLTWDIWPHCGAATTQLIGLLVMLVFIFHVGSDHFWHWVYSYIKHCPQPNGQIDSVLPVTKDTFHHITFIFSLCFFLSTQNFWRQFRLPHISRSRQARWFYFYLNNSQRYWRPRLSHYEELQSWNKLFDSDNKINVNISQR